ncbi:MAG: hypothetical protein ACOH2S_27255 [Janthinobacterium svalbardensis]
MKRIDGLDPAIDLFGPGRHGFQEQVPGVSLATGLKAKWFNAVQESIVRTIEAAGLQLSEADMGQFVAALGVLDAAARDAAIVVAAQDATNKANSARIAAINSAASDASAKANAVIPSGTRMLFQQTNAPVGWTKDVTHNDKALRVVNGAAGAGGALDFSAAFVNGSVGATTLTIAQIPIHDHGTPVFARDGSSARLGDGGGTPTYSGLRSGSTGGGESHTHTLDLAIKYVDIIIATKN